MRNNHQVLSSFLQSWLNNHLANTSVIELGYSLYDIEKNRYLLISTNTAWRNQFLNHGLDRAIISLLQSDIFLLSSQSPIKQLYNQLHNENYCKTMFVFRGAGGFEMFEVTNTRELSYRDQSNIRLLLLNLAYELNEYIKNKIDTPIYSKIKELELVKAQHAKEATYFKQPSSYKLARFEGELNLTTHEQLCIESLIVHRTQKEIASRQNCSVARIRKKLIKIKHKLGDSTMPTSKMMIELKKRGVLSIFSEA
jgi:hypothetical protein